MSLSPRQLALYVHKVDIWRESALEPGADATVFTKVNAAVPCLFGSAPSWEEPISDGLDDAQKLPLLESVAIAQGIAVLVGDRFQIVAAPNGSADVGKWLAVIGDPAQNGWKANRQKVWVRSTVAPEGV